MKAMFKVHENFSTMKLSEDNQEGSSQPWDLHVPNFVMGRQQESATAKQR